MPIRQTDKVDEPSLGKLTCRQNDIKPTIVGKMILGEPSLDKSTISLFYLNLLIIVP